MAKNHNKKIYEQPSLYLLVGIASAIIIARLYVYLGGDLGLGYDGIRFHHIFLGIILVIVAGLISFSLSEKLRKNVNIMCATAFAFGFGVGLISDEANFLISVGQYYNLSNYYQPINLYVDTIFIVFAFLLFIFSTFIIKRK
jgi:membrane protease YdiL (CAAX protease family)